jgi:CBS domain-containing protein
MLGDVQDDAMFESEFADEYQDWLQGHPGNKRAGWFDFPVRKLARRQPLRVEPAQSVQDVARRMTETHSASALVIEGGKLRGIFTEHDLLERVVSAGRDPASTRVEEVMTGSPEALPATATMAQALRFLARGHYRQAPLVDDAGAPVGMLSTRQVVGFVSETFPKEILNAPPESAEPPLQEEGA